MTRKADSLEIRARELAFADGIDPDSRIPKEGSARGQPAWIPYREAAKAERFRQEQESLRASTKAIQDEQYKNHSLKIVGTHESNTIEQMVTCLQFGNVVGGVLCADGHLGYSQPVGGVIAYEDQISVSGVGYDIACFSGDTKIFTLEGRNPTLKSIENKEVWILACDIKGTPIPAKGKCLKTRFNSELLCIKLDNGKKIKCTSDHLFMTRKGRYRRADNLIIGQSLMPFYSVLDEDGYLLVKNNAERKHPLALQRLVYKTINAPGIVLGDNLVVHHKNHKRIDNRPENLELMTREEHGKMHASRRDFSYMKTEDYENNRIRAIKDFWEKARENKEFMEKRDESRARKQLNADNHKVVSIKRLNKKEDVYCLVVPGENNFALSAGVFVHNCGNCAVKLDITYPQIARRVDVIARDIARNVSFGIGRKNTERAQHSLFDKDGLWQDSGMAFFKKKAEEQLGTVGSGNHYVDLFYDECGNVWIGVHFGSRGLGHTTATKFLKEAGEKDGIINVAPTILEVNSDIGQRYLVAMELAGMYAYAGREWVVERVREIIGAKFVDSVHNHHNFAWKEQHNGKELWVVRKGATPSAPGQRGFVGGSMGDDAVIIHGADTKKNKELFYSTIHGAGRVCGRAEAKRRFTRRQMDEWIRQRGVTLIGAGLDESPMSYRRLPDVLAEHGDTIVVENRLRPFVVVMAGEKETDPFRD